MIFGEFEIFLAEHFRWFCICRRPRPTTLPPFLRKSYIKRRARGNPVNIGLTWFLFKARFWFKGSDRRQFIGSIWSVWPAQVTDNERNMYIAMNLLKRRMICSKSSFFVFRYALCSPQGGQFWFCWSDAHSDRAPLLCNGNGTGFLPTLVEMSRPFFYVRRLTTRLLQYTKITVVNLDLWSLVLRWRKKFSSETVQ